MSSQILEVVTGWLHAYQYHLGLRTRFGFIYGTAQLFEPALVHVDLESGRHDLAQAVMHHHQVEVLADIQGDAQYLRWRNTSNQIGKGLTTLSFYMSGHLLGHGNLSPLSVDIPTSQTGAGCLLCASHLL